VRRARYESQDTTAGEREGGADFLSAGKAQGKFLVVRLYRLFFRLGLAGESPSHQQAPAGVYSLARSLARSVPPTQQLVIGFVACCDAEFVAGARRVLLASRGTSNTRA